jgi:hypothetical protein
MANNKNMTIVTAFINGINVREDRKTDEYMRLGKELLKIPIPKIVFMDRKTFKEYFFNSTAIKYNHKNNIFLYESIEFPTTNFIPIEYEEMYLFQRYLNKKTENFDIITKNPKKDTIEFMMVQCMKTEWMKQCIEMDIYESSQFSWIDFGAFHFIQNETVFQEGILKMSCQSYDEQVRIPCGKPPDYTYFSKNVYHHVIWLFLGSIFGGGKTPLLQFAKLVKEKCEMILKTKHHLMWEINIWYLVFYENIHLFSRYIVGHDKNMLEKY